MNEMLFFLENWEVLSLVISNIVALFIKRPQDWSKQNG
jgi:hypothetical protein